MENRQAATGGRMSKSFETSKAKQACRDKLVELTKEHIVYPKLFVTLPSKFSLCAKTFKNTFKKTNIIGIERDPDIFNQICQDGIYCVNSNIRQWVHAQTIPTTHVDVIFMDYYSYLHEGIVDDIKAFLNNKNILHDNKRCLLALTLSKGMRVGKESTMEFLKDYLWDNELVENEVSTIGEALINIITCNERMPKSAACIYDKEYRTGQQMYFFVFDILM
jgi:hypothetical protein